MPQLRKKRRIVCDACRKTHKACHHTTSIVHIKEKSLLPRSAEVYKVDPATCLAVVRQYLDKDHFSESVWLDQLETHISQSKTLRHAATGFCLAHLYENRTIEALEEIDHCVKYLRQDIASNDQGTLEISLLTAGLLGLAHFSMAEPLSGFVTHISGVISILMNLLHPANSTSEFAQHLSRKRVPSAANRETVSLHWIYVSPFFENFDRDLYTSNEHGDLADLLNLVCSALHCSFQPVDGRRDEAIKNIHHLCRVVPQLSRSGQLSEKIFIEVFMQGVYCLTYMCLYPHRQVPVSMIRELEDSIRISEAEFGSLMFPRLVVGWHTRRSL